MSLITRTTLSAISVWQISAISSNWKNKLQVIHTTSKYRANMCSCVLLLSFDCVCANKIGLFLIMYTSTHSQFVLCSRFKCRRCVNRIQVKPPPEDATCNSDLSQWNHCADRKTIPDSVLKSSWDAGITFAFHQKSHEPKLVP